MSGKDDDSRCHEGECNQSDLVTLVDDEGNEHDFMIEDIFEYRDKRYAVLVPSPGSMDDEDEMEEDESEEDWEDDEEDEEDLEAYIFRIDEVEGEEVLVEVEDEQEWEQVSCHWENLRRDQDQGWEQDRGEDQNFDLDEDEDLN